MQCKSFEWADYRGRKHRDLRYRKKSWGPVVPPGNKSFLGADGKTMTSLVENKHLEVSEIDLSSPTCNRVKTRFYALGQRPQAQHWRSCQEIAATSQEEFSFLVWVHFGRRRCPFQRRSLTGPEKEGISLLPWQNVLSCIWYGKCISQRSFFLQAIRGENH